MRPHPPTSAGLLRRRPRLLVGLAFGAMVLAGHARARADAAHPTVFVLLQLDAKASVVETGCAAMGAAECRFEARPA